MTCESSPPRERCVAALSVVHGLAHNREVCLSQEISGGEAGALDNDFIYVKQ